MACVESGGTATSQFGRLTISDAATLDGMLNLALVNGFGRKLRGGCKSLSVNCSSFAMPSSPAGAAALGSLRELHRRLVIQRRVRALMVVPIPVRLAEHYCRGPSGTWSIG